LVCFFSLLGSLAITYGFIEPFEKRRAKQHELKFLGAFAVAIDAKGSISSLVDLKGAVGIHQRRRMFGKKMGARKFCRSNTFLPLFSWQ
jgi:hypothetical protein